jgi:transposase InsO family protein
MEITTTVRKPFQRCAMDIVGPTTVTNKGNRYILTFQNDLTKFVVAEPFPTQNAEIVAREFVHNSGLKSGIPEVVLTDQGSNFLDELFQNTCKLQQIKRIHNTASNPNLTSGIERGHMVLVEYLTHYVTEDQRETDDWITYATRVQCYDSPSHWVLAC